MSAGLPPKSQTNLAPPGQLPVGVGFVQRSIRCNQSKFVFASPIYRCLLLRSSAVLPAERKFRRNHTEHHEHWKGGQKRSEKEGPKPIKAKGRQGDEGIKQPQPRPLVAHRKVPLLLNLFHKGEFFVVAHHRYSIHKRA
ncbi:hypothetical protein U9M48_034005 [Paspalum notatum var. saurae]|uniref:Uncharacterized protein n=1 Tax=Paspalum notatum var. saurae TaxID=547442 RepID=A0AAQ3U8M8_PASNO